MNRKIVISLFLLLILGLGVILAVRFFRGGETVVFPTAATTTLLDSLPAGGWQQAVRYALTYYGNQHNDSVYPYFGINGSMNCANFVSQVLTAGHILPHFHHDNTFAK